MKIALIGASGQLGTDLAEVFRRRGDEVISISHSEVDIRDSVGLMALIVDVRPNVVVSTAAFHKVEECEKQPLVAFEVNAVGAQSCSKLNIAGCALVYFSTDYVFSGTQQEAYSESDLPEPLSVYGTSKLAGEHLIAFGCSRHFIVRTCGLYGLAGSSGKGGNFVENILKKASMECQIRVVKDQVLTPSYTVDVAEAVVQLISTARYGTYHISNEGECSWYRFTKEIFALEGLPVNVEAVTSDQFPTLVKRPPYSVLSKGKLRNMGIGIPRWEDALARYLAARKLAQSRGSGCTSGEE